MLRDRHFRKMSKAKIRGKKERKKEGYGDSPRLERTGESWGKLSRHTAAAH